MTRRPPFASTFSRAAILAVAALSASAPAIAQRALQLNASEAKGYGRIVAKWADGSEIAPAISASVSNQVLVMRFAEPVSADLAKLQANLPSWAAIARIDPDGQTLRVGLKRDAKVRASTSVDLVAVDLVTDGTPNPPALVSPLVAKRAAESAAKKAAQEAAAAAPTVKLEVRGSHNDDSSRLAFYWDQTASYKATTPSPDVLQLQFSKQARADLAYLKIDPPPQLADFKGENTPRGYVVKVTAKPGNVFRHFMDGDVPVVDIGPPLAPETKTAAAPAPKKPAAKAPEKVKEDDKGLLAPPKEALAADVAVLSDATPADLIGGPARTTVMRASWSDPAPRSGALKVASRPVAGGLELGLTFDAPAPAAVFRRNGSIWAVFAANADLSVTVNELPAGFRVATRRDRNAAILKIDAPSNLTLSANASGNSWVIRLAPTAVRPQRFIKVVPGAADKGRSVLTAMTPGAAGIVWFTDAATGEDIAAIVAYGPASALPTPYAAVDADLPATAQGLAVVAESDDVVVELAGEKVQITFAAGATTASKVASAGSAQVVSAGDAAFMDIKAWGGLRGKAWYEKRKSLERAAARTKPDSVEGAAAMMELARFYVGHDLAAEAIGALEAARSAWPEIDEDPRFLGLLGASNAMAGRLKEADEALGKGPLRSDPSAVVWRAQVAADGGNWERAAELFRSSDKEISRYPKERAARFSARYAEAAFRTNDFASARRQATLATGSNEKDVSEWGKFTLAEVTSVVEGAAAAYPEFVKLAKSPVETVAVRAELKRLETGVAAGKGTAAEAVQDLETLRFRWRGDDVEMATVGILSDQYMKVGRFRDALLLTKATSVRDPNAPGARDLRIRQTDYFRRLYLNGEADRLDPIQSLALFYEFADLTPIGADGDMMVRKLAQRLVAFDLLEPAAQLLQHQVDNRMRGMGKSAIAVDLATIYLFDHRPDKALAALNSTRQPSMPRTLALERRMLEAAAYRDLGRFDHVIELMEPLDLPDARHLLGDAYIRSRQYPEALQTFTALLPPPDKASASDAPTALKAAIAARMEGDATAILNVRKYAPIFADDPRKASFDLLTAQTDISGVSIAEAVRRLADVPTLDAFEASMKARFESGKDAQARAAATAAPAAAPAPAKPAPVAAKADAKKPDAKAAASKDKKAADKKADDKKKSADAGGKAKAG